MFDFPPVWGKLKMIRPNFREPKEQARSVASTPWIISTLLNEAVIISRFSWANSLLTSCSRRSSEVATIVWWKFAFDKAAAKQRENEKFPSPTTSMSPPEGGMCNNRHLPGFPDKWLSDIFLCHMHTGGEIGMRYEMRAHLRHPCPEKSAAPQTEEKAKSFYLGYTLFL